MAVIAQKPRIERIRNPYTCIWSKGGVVVVTQKGLVVAVVIVVIVVDVVVDDC